MVSDGFVLFPGQDLHAKLTAERRIDSRGEPLDQQGLELRYFAPQSLRSAFYGAIVFDCVARKLVLG